MKKLLIVALFFISPLFGMQKNNSPREHWNDLLEGRAALAGMCGGSSIQKVWFKKWNVEPFDFSQCMKDLQWAETVASFSKEKRKLVSDYIEDHKQSKGDTEIELSLILAGGLDWAQRDKAHNNRLRAARTSWLVLKSSLIKLDRNEKKI